MKLWVIIGLMRERLWYYPVALVIFTLFIVYQMHRYMLTHSVSLLLLTIVDLVVIWLTWHEYRYLLSRGTGQPDRETAPNADPSAGAVNRRRGALFSG